MRYALFCYHTLTHSSGREGEASGERSWWYVREEASGMYVRQVGSWGRDKLVMGWMVVLVVLSKDGWVVHVTYTFPREVV